MAKPVRRGLPSDFALDLPDDGPVVLGDFLDEPPPPIPVRKQEKLVEKPEPAFRPEIVPERRPAEGEEPRPVKRVSNAPSVIRCQLNLTPKSKKMLEEVVKYVRTYSPENDARTSEVFQGIIGLLHSAMDELDLAELPRRGAWGSVTAKNFPGGLGDVFERAIVRAAGERGG